MPLFIETTAPLTAANRLPVASIYAIIENTSYNTREKIIRFGVGFYASEQAFDEYAQQLGVNPEILPQSYAFPATAEEANAVPLFDTLEQVITATLLPLLPEGSQIRNSREEAAFNAAQPAEDARAA